MIKINAYTGESETVPSNSQVKKKGPCKQSDHGPCFTFSNSDRTVDSMDLLFWNNYGYVMTWFPTDPSYPAVADGPIDGCQFNQLVKKFVSNGEGGAPLEMNHPLYYRTV